MLQATAGQLSGSATGGWPMSAGLGDKGNRDIHLSLFSKPAWEFTHWVMARLPRTAGEKTTPNEQVIFKHLLATCCTE